MFMKRMENEVVVNHPIMYVSGLFKGRQMNWAALTKEAYAMLIHVQKKAYVLFRRCMEITLRSDHLPLKRVSTMKYITF